MNVKNVLRLRLYLSISWFAEIGAFILFFVFSSKDGNPLAQLLFIASIVAGLLYYVFLGVLASRLGKSWILWVGLTMLSSPIGFFVSYTMMLARVKDAIELPALGNT